MNPAAYSFVLLNTSNELVEFETVRDYYSAQRERYVGCTRLYLGITLHRQSPRDQPDPSASTVKAEVADQISLDNKERDVHVTVATTVVVDQTNSDTAPVVADANAIAIETAAQPSLESKLIDSAAEGYTTP